MKNSLIKKLGIFASILLTLNTVKAQFPCGDTLVDSRDGQKYPTVLIGDQCWMAKNFNIGTRINGVINQTNNEIIEKYCYDDSTGNCDIYGGLYQLEEMMQYTPSDTGTIGTTQGICLAGWHIPTDKEWKTLEIYLGMSQSEADTKGFRGAQGGKLKTGTNHWTSPNVGATNSSGFTGLPGGNRNYGSFVFGYLNITGYWWSATKENINSKSNWIRGVRYTDTKINRDTLYYPYGYSIRCLSDNFISGNKELNQNLKLGLPYPNPVNSNLTIPYSTIKYENVSLTISDKLGRKLETITKESKGKDKFNFNMSEYSSGIYFYNLITGTGYSKAGKFVKE